MLFITVRNPLLTGGGKLHQLFLVMRITTILLLAGFLHVSAAGFSQKVTISGKNIPLKTLFATIEKQTGYVFVYDDEILVDAKAISIHAENRTIQEVLDECFKNQSLSYSIEDKTIFISKKNPAPESKAVLKDTPNEVWGVIRMESGSPLAGATVSIAALKKTSFTDENGYFLLRNVPNGTHVVEMTFVGYETFKKAIVMSDNRVRVDVSLKQSINSLDETVVKGYYTTTKRLNTGNVSTVKGEDIQKQPVTDPLLALEGRVPGLFIQQQSGVPGAQVTVMLRGRNSIANGNDPLYIVDGMPFNSASLTNPTTYPAGVQASPFNSLNPGDIESIEILKDADATAIYGSRGANGVILITTKKGKSGVTKVDLNINSGFGKIDRKMDLLNLQQYLQMRHEAFTNDSANPQSYDYDINGTWDTTRSTDWQKVLIGGTAKLTNSQLSISGGNLYTQFILGAGFTDQTTVLPGDFSDKKGSIHLNLNHASINRKFHLNLSSSYLNDNNNLPQQDPTSYITLPPDAPMLYDSTGNLNWQNNTWINPIAGLNAKYKAVTRNLIGNLELSYEIAPDLRIKSSFNYNYITDGEIITTPMSVYPSQYASYPQLRNTRTATNTINSWNIEPQISYQKQLGNGKLDILFGTTFLETMQNGVVQNASNFPNDALLENIRAASSIRVLNQSYSQYKYTAAFGRIGFNWQDKYILNLTARRDGSSRFGPGNQFGNFGAIGAGWIFSKESFAKPFLSYGKLRISYGTTGNDQIGDYQFLSTYSPYNYPYLGLTGLYPEKLPNSYYGWELVKKMEGGIELGFIKDRILLTTSYYHNRTGNQLVGYSLPTLTGGSFIIANLPAVVQNSGVEAELKTILTRNKKISWTAAINLTIPRNKLVSYPNLAGSNYANYFVVGQPLYISKRFHFVGVDNATGIMQFQSKSGPTTSPTYPDDLQSIKKIAQNYFGGFQNSFSYGGWSLDIFIQFVKQTGYNYMAYFSMPGAMSNQPTFVLNSWRKLGDQTTIQKFSENFSSDAGTAYLNGANNGDNVISDASFIRLKNLSVAYNVSSKYLTQAHLQEVKIYLQCQNLFTITNYSGIDPETQGITMPPIKMMTIGIQVGL